MMKSKNMGHREFIILMALLISVFAISIDALLPALGIIGSDFMLQNQNHTQYVIGLFFLGEAFGQLLWGPLSDAIGRKKVLNISIVIYLIGSVICYFSGSFSILLLARFIQGFGAAGPYVTSISVVRDKYSGRDMAQVMSIIMMVFMAVPALAPSLGQLIINNGSWRTVFMVYIVYSMLITLWIICRMEETLPKQNRISFTTQHLIHGAKEVLGNRVTLGYMLCMGICFGSIIGYLNSAPQIFQSYFDTGKMFSIYFGGLAIVLSAASFVNSVLVKKYGMYYICLRSFICIIAASILFLILTSVVKITLVMFLIYAAILFFCFGLLFGNLNSIAMEPMGHIAGIAAAITGSVAGLLSMLIGGIIGQLYNNTLIPLTLGFLVLGILCTVIIIWAERGRVR
jgi:DHA1 family bicyclomycin/chloramphenicol resistance-like MFS transporter